MVNIWFYTIYNTIQLDKKFTTCIYNKNILALYTWFIFTEYIFNIR